MRKGLIAVVVVLVLAALGGVGALLFVRHEHGSLVAKSERDCYGRDQPAAGAPAALPLALPLTAGASVLDVTEQGRTVVAFAKVAGGREDIVRVRDAVLADLKGAGYSVAGTDQEPGYEAEAELAGTHEGTLKVSPLCEGLLELRYKIDS